MASKIDQRTDITSESYGDDIELNKAVETIAAIRISIRALLQHQNSVLVAIAGGSATGKSGFFSPALTAGFPSTLVISEDDYCIGNSISAKLHGTLNLHVPEDYDPELLSEHITALKNRQGIDKPVYSYEIRERIGSTRVDTANLIVIEGEFLLHPPLSNQFDIKVFIRTDDHSRFVRRIIRPRRSVKQTDLERIQEYFKLSFPRYHSDISPTVKQADFVIDNFYDTNEGKSRIDQREREIVLVGSNADKLFSSLYPNNSSVRFSRHYYTHSGCKPKEVIYVHNGEPDGSHLRYSCGSELEENWVTTPYVAFHLGEQNFDLKDIGYNHLLDIEGEESVVNEHDINLHFVSLLDGRKVVHITQSTKAEDTTNLRQTIQKLMAGGLSVSPHSFDEWILI